MNPATPVVCSRHRFISAALGLAGLAFPVCGHAADFYWNAASGNWTDTGYANWLDGSNAVPTSFPTTGTNGYYLQNGTAGLPASTTLATPNFAGRVMNSVTIGSNNTLFLSGISTTGSAGHLRVTGAFSNTGLISSGTTSTDNVRLELAWATGGSVINTGTMTAAEGTLRLASTSSLNSAITNTGGLLKAESGGTFALQYFTVNNGTVRSDVGGIIETGEMDVQVKATLTGVAVDNQGTFRVRQSVVAGGNRTMQTTVNGSSAFVNTGTTLVSSVVNGTHAEANTSYDVRFDLAGTASFDNTGTIRVSNASTRTNASAGTYNQYATFAVGSTATFASTGKIEVFHESAVASTYSRFTAAQSITNQGLVHVRGNTANTGASFQVTGSGNTYVQSGAGSRTLLERGGVLSAETVQIDAGDLGGVGTVSGIDTIIGSAARLVAGDTLASGPTSGALVFNSHLGFEDGASVLFGLGADTAGSGRIMLGAGCELTIGENVAISFINLGGASFGTTYRLFETDGGSITGSFTLGALPEGFAGTFTTGSNYIDFTLTDPSAVPEPGAFALLAGLGVLGWGVLRRRDCRK